MSGTATIPHNPPAEWTLPSRGIVGMACLIIAEAAIFIIFVVAYIFYIGKSLTGPMPKDVLELPIFTSICLLSSSATVHWAVSSLTQGKSRLTTLWLAATVLLGGIFLAGTAHEWYDLIYSLVGLHASHVMIGLIMLSIALVFSLTGSLTHRHHERLEVLSLYWHFVDEVWVVVFLVVYVVGR